MGELPKGTISETVRQRRDRLTGQPQEREHSGANGARERLAPARGTTTVRDGIVTGGRDPASRVGDLTGLGERSD
jgi:hypothetical protein